MGQSSHTQTPANSPPAGGVGECRAEGPAPGGDRGEGFGPSQEPGPAEQAGEPGAGAEGKGTVQVGERVLLPGTGRKWNSGIYP